MAKEKCVVCGKTNIKFGFFVSEIKDGKICFSCQMKLAMKDYTPKNDDTLDQINNVLKRKQKHNNNRTSDVNFINRDENEEKTKLFVENDNKYKKYTSESFAISEKIWSEKIYSKAINQPNINNKYADEYIELCYRLLELLPYGLEHDKEEAKIRGKEYIIRGLGNDLINFIRLLEKQSKHKELIFICDYLLSLGFTADGTKKGIKGRIEKAVTNFNAENNTNYIYLSDKNLIIDENTGEIFK